MTLAHHVSLVLDHVQLTDVSLDMAIVLTLQETALYQFIMLFEFQRYMSLGEVYQGRPGGQSVLGRLFEAPLPEPIVLLAA